MKRKIMYLVFGTEMTRAVDEKPISEIDFKLTGGCFYKWDSAVNSLRELVDASFGWDDYMEISKEQWEEYLRATGQVEEEGSQA